MGGQQIVNKVRIGIIGIGGMGGFHAKHIDSGSIDGAILTAVCDIREESRLWAQQNLREQVEFYTNEDEFLRSTLFDAVLIATPHYDHPRLAIKSFEFGLHVLIEKPAGVYTKQVRVMNEVAHKSGRVFSIMYNQRTNSLYQKLKELIASGEIGEVRRINWIITNWYRSQSYYDAGTWRGTWKGEGGGVLINQCPHQIDLLQWIPNMMPQRIRSFCKFGKYRNIEVEDEVTAYLEYENGATAVFITTTADACGTNRLEISGEKGKFVVEHEKLSFDRLRVSETEFNQSFKGGFGSPESWKCEIPIVYEESGHKGIIQNFVHAISGRAMLIAPGEEGIRGLSISNAIHLSTWIDDWVQLPLDEDLYYNKLQSLF
jgi:predicted dehydrogenase